MSLRPFVVSVLAGLLFLPACGDRSIPTGLEAPLFKQAVLPGAPLVTINTTSGSTRFLPYLTDDLVTPQDPVNLILEGTADPRAVRDALLGLDGQRGAPFPPVVPFTCTWSDAIGGLMAGYEEATGWGGAAVQLQCGTYGPIRFHLRLVRAGPLTLGNAHFEVLIPGTTDHQVLSWELAEQLVTYDLARTGLLGAAPTSTGAITTAPTHRAIPAIIYNGLPVELRALAGGPLADVSTDVGIANDGQARRFLLAGAAAPAPAGSVQHEVIAFHQLIPKPFCVSGPADFLLVQGPVTLDQAVTTGPNGELRTSFRAAGDLVAMPVDPATGLPAGAAFAARVSEHQESRAGDEGGRVAGMQHQQLLPAGLPGAGSLVIRLSVAPGKDPDYDRTVTCK